jgi:uncharacterized membrane protein
MKSLVAKTVIVVLVAVGTLLALGAVAGGAWWVATYESAEDRERRARVEELDADIVRINAWLERKQRELERP